MLIANDRKKNVVNFLELCRNHLRLPCSLFAKITKKKLKFGVDFKTHFTRCFTTLSMEKLVVLVVDVYKVRRLHINKRHQ